MSDRPDDPVALNLARILFRLVRDPRGWRVDDLKARLGIADRTYRKYRLLLQDHFPELADEDGRSLVVEARDGDARWLRLRDSNEPADGHPRFFARVAALELAGQAFGFLRATEVGEDLDAFRQDFLDHAGDRTFVFRSLLRDLDRKLHHRPDAPKDYRGQEDKVRVLLRALFWCRRLETAYESGRGPSGPRVLEPLTLVVWRSGLYLVARDPGGHEPRPYAVDRMSDVRLNRETFRYPPPAEWSPERFFDGAFGFFVAPDAPATEVELVFADRRWLKLYLRERTWHPTQRFEDLPDGRLRMTFTVRGLNEVRTWVRGFGPDVEAIRPAGL